MELESTIKIGGDTKKIDKIIEIKEKSYSYRDKLEKLELTRLLERIMSVLIKTFKLRNGNSINGRRIFIIFP